MKAKKTVKKTTKITNRTELKKTNYPELPFISIGILPKNKGIYITLPFPPISINEYKKMHFGLIKKTKQRYKAILDVMAITYYRKDAIECFDMDGIYIKSLFETPIHIEWILNHKLNRKRDTGNYTQKILLDAMVWIGLIKDDNEEYVLSDKVYFGHNGKDSITCLLLGDVFVARIKGDIPKVKLSDIYENLGVKGELHDKG